MAAEDPEARPRGAAAPLALDVRGLSKSYGDAWAVRDLSFRVACGEILGLVGPNGAGKTTTLRTIAGVLPLRHGRVTICGHDLVEQELEAKRRLAWVPEDPAPFDSLTVREHLEFTAALYRVPDAGPWGDELLELFELSEKADALGGELSRGMRQKLSFCCAWLSRPSLLLLDEPLSGLDPRGIRSAKDAIRALAARDVAVILSSHLLDLIQELCDRILVLDRGRAVFDGTLVEARRAHASAGGTLEEIFFRITGAGGGLSEGGASGAG